MLVMYPSKRKNILTRQTFQKINNQRNNCINFCSRESCKARVHQNLEIGLKIVQGLLVTLYISKLK